MAKEILDAVKTARSIHDGDYSSLRGKSFLVCGNIKNNQGRKKPVKKRKSKYTLNEIGDALFAFIKSTNTRFDNLEKDVHSLKQDVKDINARLDYYGLQIEQINKRLDYNGLKQLPKNR